MRATWTHSDRHALTMGIQPELIQVVVIIARIVLAEWKRVSKREKLTLIRSTSRFFFVIVADLTPTTDNNNNNQH